MNKKHKSILKAVFETVTKIPWLKGTRKSAHKHMKPGKGFNQPVSTHAFDYMKELNDNEFEKLIVMIFKQRGYTVSEKRNRENHAVDVVLHLNHEATLVQYMHWREHHVDAAAIEAFYSVLDDESAPYGIIITTGIFTDDALEAAQGKNLMLINGIDLSLMVNALSTSNEAGTLESEIEEEKQEMPELEPLCPICSCKMIKRTAKKGKNAGNTFWGCSKFPNCRGVVSN